jgi:hypothetical protein
MSHHDAPIPDAAKPPSPFELSGRQREVLDVLAREGDQAGVLYLGALRVLTDLENPTRLRLAAYSLRELLNDLHHGPKRDDLPVRVRRLRRGWQITRQSEDSGFDETLTRFFAEFEQNYPQRRELVSKTIERLDPSGRKPSPAVSRARGDAWMALTKFCNKILHGNRATTDDEFYGELTALEDFLLGLIRPTTFADFDQLDDLMLEGPPDG